MKKKFLLFGALVGALLLSSCSGGSKKQTVSSESTEELDNASKVINYYHMSLAVLRHVANAKDINAVLGYMEQTGKVPEVEPIAPMTVIHGKGTGVLRKAVQERLKRHPSVKSYRLGKYGEGEAGVTIVELK